MGEADMSAAVRRMREESLRPRGVLPPPGTVSLAMGEPDFDTPPRIVAAANRALAEGWTKYGDLNGDPELREVIAARTGNDPENVLITHGGSAGLAATALALLNPGDRVVLPDPHYSLYADQLHLVGAVPVRVPSLPDGHLDLDRIAAVLPGARMFVFCNPCNPTGVVLREDELLALAELADRADVLVLADEAYADFCYDRPFCSALSVASLRPRLIHSHTLSKSYAMTGWRVGHIVAPVGLIGSIAMVHRTMNASINAAAQRAALTALTDCDDAVASMVGQYRERRDLLTRLLAAIPELDVRSPEGAFYVFPRCRLSASSTEVARALLAGGVAVRPGSEFGPGGEGHLRLSFAAAPEALVEGASRLGTVLAALGADE